MANIFSKFTTGLSITDRAVQVVRFVSSGKNLLFDTYRELPLTASVYDIDRLSRPQELASALRSLDKNLLQGQIVIAIPDGNEADVYQSLLKQVGLATKKIVSLTEAESRAVIEEEENDVILLVSSHSHYLELSIVRSGRVLSRAVVPVGIEEIISTLSRALAVPRSDASDLVYAVGLSQRELDQTILHTLAPVVVAWGDVIGQALQAWTALQKEEGYKEKMVERLVVCGDVARIPGLVGYLSGRVGLPVSVGNPWVNLEAAAQEVPNLLYDDSLRFAGAIGAGLLSR